MPLDRQVLLAEVFVFLNFIGRVVEGDSAHVQDNGPVS